MQSLSETLSSGEIGLKHVPELLKRVLSEGMWRERIVPQTREVASFDTFQQFVESTPPNGLGATVHLLRRMCNDDVETLDLIDQAMQRGPGKTWDSRTVDNTVDIVNNNPRPTGNTAASGLRRLRKMAASSPAVAELQSAVLGGEMSVNAALVQAGLREKTITIPVNPQRAAGAIMRHFTTEQVNELVSLLTPGAFRAMLESDRCSG